ncbi:MAG: hypothetical protein H6752_06815 [Candidatus Omnitrophica bacterium]|nr:hypothetical protein [Candidatus Omnitrophota bacterium]
MIQKEIKLGAILLVLLSSLVCGAQDSKQQEWQEQLRKKRAEIAQQNAAKEATKTEEIAPEPAGKDEGQIILNGKVITTKRKGPPPAAAQPNAPAAPNLQSATAAVGSATPPAPSQAAPAPTATPAMVKIKKTKIVGGKILTVEVEVTPTPGPATSDTPPQSASGEQTAQAAIPSVTGYMLEVKQKLHAASKSTNDSMRFDAKMIAKLREEFMKQKDQPSTAKVVSPTEALEIQSDLQRLSSIARGGNLKKETAEILLKVLFPAPEPEKKGIVITGGGQLEEMKRQKAEEQKAGAEQSSESPAQGEQQERQIYVDPQTGQYFYEDGTPVQSNEEEQQGQYYYDDAGNLYYQVGNQVYYVQDGEFYLLEN